MSIIPRDFPPVLLILTPFGAKIDVLQLHFGFHGASFAKASVFLGDARTLADEGLAKSDFLGLDFGTAIHIAGAAFADAQFQDFRFIHFRIFRIILLHFVPPLRQDSIIVPLRSLPYKT
jgi:hypothetical protein